MKKLALLVAVLFAACYEEHLERPAPPHPIRYGRILSMVPKLLRVDLYDAGLPGAAQGLEFTVAESGVVRTPDREAVQYLMRHDQKIALVLDYSSSMDYDLVESSARAFLARLNDNQKVAIYTFADTVRRESIYTPDKKFLSEALDCTDLDLATAKNECVREPWAKRKSILRTDVFKAVRRVIDELPDVDVDRQVAVVVTDGNHDQSNSTLRLAVLRDAATLGVPVFILALNGEEGGEALRELAGVNAGEYIPAQGDVAVELGFDRIAAALTPSVTLVYQAYDSGRRLPLEISAHGGRWASSFAVDVSAASAGQMDLPIVIAQPFGGLPGGTSRLDLDAVYFPSQVTQADVILTWSGDIKLEAKNADVGAKMLTGLAFGAVSDWTYSAYGEWQTQATKAVAFKLTGPATSHGRSGRLVSIPALVSPGLDVDEVVLNVAVRINGRTYLECIPAHFVNLDRAVPNPVACSLTPDSDGDGKSDWAEAAYGSNPVFFNP